VVGRVRREAELGEDGGDMTLQRRDRHNQVLGDKPVRSSAGDEPQNLELLSDTAERRRVLSPDSHVSREQGRSCSRRRARLGNSHYVRILERGAERDPEAMEAEPRPARGARR
jgi:hypothetical protein